MRNVCPLLIAVFLSCVQAQAVNSSCLDGPNGTPLILPANGWISTFITVDTTEYDGVLLRDMQGNTTDGVFDLLLMNDTTYQIWSQNQSALVKFSYNQTNITTFGWGTWWLPICYVSKLWIVFYNPSGSNRTFGLTPYMDGAYCNGPSWIYKFDTQNYQCAVVYTSSTSTRATAATTTRSGSTMATTGSGTHHDWTSWQWGVIVGAPAAGAVIIVLLAVIIFLVLHRKRSSVYAIIE